MKFILLFSFVFAVSNASFSRSLLRESGPLVSQSGLQLRIAVLKTNDFTSQTRTQPRISLTAVGTVLADQIQQQLNALLSQIESGVQVANQLVTQVVNQLQQSAQGLSGSLEQLLLDFVHHMQNLIGQGLPSNGKIIESYQRAGTKSFLSDIMATALGVSSETVESLLAVLSSVMGVYADLKPLIDAINIPALLQGAGQAVLNHDVTQWLIYEVAPATLPQSAIDALNAFIVKYFGPGPAVSAKLLSRDEASLATYLQELYQEMIVSATSTVTTLHQFVNQFIADAETTANELLQQAIQNLVGIMKPRLLQQIQA